MSNRKATFLYGFLIALASLAAGMVLASRLDLTPSSLARTLHVPDTNSAPLNGPIDASTFRNIAQAQNPTVVSIRTEVPRRVNTSRDQGMLEEFFQLPSQPRGRQQGPRNLPPAIGGGSGFIIDKSGFILTNNHVVEDATKIEVFLYGMDTRGQAPGLEAKVVGKDVLTDSALLQLVEMPKTPLVEAKFGDSSALQSGDWVVAIGSPFGFTHTVTVGVVSAVARTSAELQPVAGRDLEMIQTDAAINRGNSGGPLMNVRGEVVGVNTAIISDSAGGNIGIGFAVPINTVKEVLPSLRTGKVVRGRIGVQVLSQDITEAEAREWGLPNTNAALVTTVTPKGPADLAGMKADDLILEFNGKAIRNSNELINMVTRTAPGTSVPVKIMRDGKTMTLTVKVEELDLSTEIADPEVDVPAEPEKQDDPIETGLGMAIEPLTPAASRQARVPQGRGGVVIADVDAAGPARGLFVPGDVILAINGQSVSTVDQAAARIKSARAGSQIRVVVWRGGQEQVVLVRKQ